MMSAGKAWAPLKAENFNKGLNGKRKDKNETVIIYWRG